MILVIGSYGTGIALRVPKIPIPGETVGDGVLAIGHGGKSSNQAVAAARHGATVELFTAVGDDEFGASATAMWSEEGVGHGRVKVLPELKTMVGVILVDPAGENSIAIAEGALNGIAETDIEALEELFLAADIATISFEIPIPVIESAVRQAHSMGKAIVLNPAPYKDISLEVLAMATYLVPNETEYAAMQAHGYERAAGQVLIITQGGDGVTVIHDGGDESYPAIAGLTVVDTTGAGDTFIGVLSAGLDLGMDLPSAIRQAIAASGLTVTRREVIPAIPTRAETNALLADLGE